MTRHDPAQPNDDRFPPHMLPQWEHLDRHRGSLQRRARSVRGVLLAGGAAGTLAFSALAGYESTATTDADPALATATQTSADQATDADFFSGQANAQLGTGMVTITPAAGRAKTDPDGPDPSASALPSDGAFPAPATGGAPPEPPPVGAAPSPPTNPPPPGNGAAPPPPPGNGAAPPPPDASTHPSR